MRTPADWAEAINALNASEAGKDAAACVVWWDCLSWQGGEPTPPAIMDRVRSEAQDLPADRLFHALMELGYCTEEARYRAFDVDAYYREDGENYHGRIK